MLNRLTTPPSNNDTPETTSMQFTSDSYSYKIFSDYQRKTYSNYGNKEQTSDASQKNMVFKSSSYIGNTVKTYSCFRDYFSVSAWVKPTSILTDFSIVEETPLNGFKFYISTDLNINCAFNTSFTTNPTTNNEWTFVTCSISKKEITIQQIPNTTSASSISSVNITGYTKANLFITGNTDDDCSIAPLSFLFFKFADPVPDPAPAAWPVSTMNFKDIQIYNTYIDLNFWRINMFRVVDISKTPRLVFYFNSWTSFNYNALINSNETGFTVPLGELTFEEYIGSDHPYFCSSGYLKNYFKNSFTTSSCDYPSN